MSLPPIFKNLNNTASQMYHPTIPVSVCSGNIMPHNNHFSELPQKKHSLLHKHKVIITQENSSAEN